jgi:hypothetical protein
MPRALRTLRPLARQLSSLHPPTPTPSVNPINFYDTTIESYAGRKARCVSLRSLINFGSDGVRDSTLIESANFVLEERRR